MDLWKYNENFECLQGISPAKSKILVIAGAWSYCLNEGLLNV